MLLHINPTRQRGKRTGSLARASGWYMTFFAAGVILYSLSLPCRKKRPRIRTRVRRTRFYLRKFAAPCAHLMEFASTFG